MKEFKKILVAITHSHSSNQEVGQAIRLAKENGATICLAAFDEPFTVFPQLSLVKKMKTLFSTQLEELLQRFKLQIEAAGVPVETRVIWGRNYIEIVQLVLKEQFDLVVKLADPFHVLGLPRLTGDDLSLLRKCPVPVWMLADPDRVEDNKQRVLVCLDSNEEEERTALNRKLINYGRAIAEQEQAELHLVHVWELFGEERLRGPFIHMPEEEVEQLLEETRSHHQNSLNQLMKEQKVGDSATLHLLKGQPSEVIPRYVTQENIDLIVMGTVGRTGLAGFVIGNTAENIMGNVHCSVLALKPDGFVSPISID